jgi:ABC-2 type transport system permease protein
VTAAEPTPGAGLRWALADTAALAGRRLGHLRRQPAELAGVVGFPILLLVVFAFLLGGMMTAPGGDYRQPLAPGLFTMTMLFGLSATMVAVLADAERGITDRFRSLPMSAGAVLAGRVVADVLVSAVGLAVLLGAGLLIGWRPTGGLLGGLAAVGLLLWLRFALLWVGILLGLVVRGAGAVTAVQTLEFPFAFLSGVFVAPSSMPAVPGVIAEWNPLSATAAASRELFGNPGWAPTSWAGTHPVLLALLWPAVVVAVFAPLAVRRYRGLDR